jgi:hypothetical protein
VADELDAALRGCRVYGDAPGPTRFWLAALYGSIGKKLAFEVRPLDVLLGDIAASNPGGPLLAEVRSTRRARRRFLGGIAREAAICMDMVKHLAAVPPPA